MAYESERKKLNESIAAREAIGLDLISQGEFKQQCEDVGRRYGLELIIKELLDGKNTISQLEITRGKPRTHRICIFCKTFLCRQLL